MDDFHFFFQVDLVVVIGSSLKVQPVALLPFNVDPEVPQILINRESLPHYAADIELLGNCDDIVAQLALVLGHPYTDIFKKSKFWFYHCILNESSTSNIKINHPIIEI